MDRAPLAYGDTPRLQVDPGPGIEPVVHRPGFPSPVDALTAASAEFHAVWARQKVAVKPTARTLLRHPRVGRRPGTPGWLPHPSARQQ